MRCAWWIGSPTSSNANRLVEVSEKAGTPARLIESADDIEPAMLANVACVGLSAGASTPESLVQGVVAALRERGAEKVEELSGIAENMEFALPKALRVMIQG